MNRTFSYLSFFEEGILTQGLGCLKWIKTISCVNYVFFFSHNFWRKVLFSYRNKDDVAVVDFFFSVFCF